MILLDGWTIWYFGHGRGDTDVDEFGADTDRGCSVRVHGTDGRVGLNFIGDGLEPVQERRDFE